MSSLLIQKMLLSNQVVFVFFHCFPLIKTSLIPSTSISRTSSNPHETFKALSRPDELERWSPNDLPETTSTGIFETQSNLSVPYDHYLWPPAPFDFGREAADYYIRVPSYASNNLPHTRFSALIILIIESAQHIWAMYRRAWARFEASEVSFACRGPARYDVELTIHNSDQEPGSPHHTLSISRALLAAVALLQDSGVGHLMEITPYQNGVAYKTISIGLTRPIAYRVMPCHGA